MQKPITAIIRQRYSCRTYLDTLIEENHQRRLSEFLASQRIGSHGTRARFALVAEAAQDRRPLRGLGTYGFIKGATGFIIGAAEHGPKDLEDYGYLMEHAVLFATDLGLGTCWLGGTFTKNSFADKIAVRPQECMPAVAAVGHAAPGSWGGDWLRQYAGSNSRLPDEQLFFKGRFGEPIAPGDADDYSAALQAVRWAPSASNKQPWRIVRSEDAWHLYLQRTNGYGKGSALFSLLQLADLQRVDMGIAMCHFDLTSRELGLVGRWAVDELRIDTPDQGIEYVATWKSDAG